MLICHTTIQAGGASLAGFENGLTNCKNNHQLKSFCILYLL